MGDESDGDISSEVHNSQAQQDKISSDPVGNNGSNKRRRQDKSELDVECSQKRTKRTNAEVVDLTEDDNTSNNTSTSSIKDTDVITLEDSIVSLPSRTPKASASKRRVPLVIDVTVDDSDTDSTPEPIHLKPPPTTNHLQRTPKPAPVPLVQDSPPDAPKCPICIETYINVKKRGLKIVATRCGHMFCDFCLRTALSANGRKCPKCRKNVPRGATGFIEIYDVC